MIEIVSATRHSKTQFWSQTALGTSLKRLQFDNRISARISFENRKGLPDVYNQRLMASDSPDILVFIHDDVWIDDYWIADRVISALDNYDIVGVAGNKTLPNKHISWALLSESGEWDNKSHLSGAVGHAEHPFGLVSMFGAAPADCELLDGVLLACRKTSLREANVGFDPRFDFHFYDLDLSRVARLKKLKVGTWPIAITHQSSGGFDNPSWRKALSTYQEKWRCHESDSCA
jgi:GT2 family glycosyltransferase